jgi:hypothetical protein
VLRFFFFHLYESPKYVMGRGRDAEAVEVVHKVAAYNGITSSLTLDMHRRAGRNCLASLNDVSEVSWISPTDTSRLGALRRTLRVWLGPCYASIQNTEACMVYEFIGHSLGCWFYLWLFFFIYERLTCFSALIGLAFPL